jgi:hypothetical protein
VAGVNDRKKNALCDTMGLPLARVRDEHVFQKARGIDYLSWLTELFFGARALQEAQARGHIPDDEPLNPMMFVSHPHVPGRFPLWLSAVVRITFERWRDAGILRESVPFGLHGYDQNGLGACLVVLGLSTGGMVMSESSIYLRGFGVASSDVADEIATVNLGHLVESHVVSNAATVRRELIRFLRRHTIGSWYGSSDPALGFSVENRRTDGRQHWYVGPLGGEQAITIEESHSLL